jgi:hypothetical protein
MKQPQGFLKKGKESWVCELQKSIYGLKQAPRLWHQLLDRVLGTFSHKGKHLVKSHADKCVYVLRDQIFILIVIAHVDDLFMAATTTEALDALAKHVFEQFEGRTVPPHSYSRHGYYERPNQQENPPKPAAHDSEIDRPIWYGKFVS